LHGRKERGDGGDVTFVVKKMSRDYGPCEPGFQAPVTPTTPAKIEPQPRKQVASDLERSIGATGSAAVYGVQFDTNSATLRPDSTASLEKMLAVILKRPDSRWIISGHTDNQGSAELNQKLSEARASSVIAWLVSHGIAASRFTAQGYGASRPVADNSTEEGRAKNRRVELMLVK
jgi:outer membrane protein OmpA-like peptidoglycan-associated protein